MNTNNFITPDQFLNKIQFKVHNHKGSKTMPKIQYPPSVLIPPEDMIIGVTVSDGKNISYYTMKDWEEVPDEEKQNMNYRQSNLHIRYIPGENSIFAAEQSISDEIAKRRKKYLVMYDGGMVVRRDEITKLKYLSNCNYNASNKYRSSTATPIFERFDIKAVSEKANKKLLDEAEALAKIGSMSGPELEIFALSFGEDVKRFKAIAGTDTATLRRDILLRVKANPELVQRVLESHDMAIKALVAKGMAEDIWVYDEKLQAVVWGKTQQVITKINVGTPVVNTLVELIKKDRRWRDQFDELKTQLGHDPITKKADVEIKQYVEKNKPIKISQEKVIRDKFGSYGGIVLDAIKVGALSVSTPQNIMISWLTLVNDGQTPRKWHGIKKMITAIKEEEGLLKEIQEREKMLKIEV